MALSAPGGWLLAERGSVERNPAPSARGGLGRGEYLLFCFRSHDYFVSFFQAFYNLNITIGAAQTCFDRHLKNACVVIHYLNCFATVFNRHCSLRNG